MLLEELPTTSYDAAIVGGIFLAAAVSKYMFWLFLHWRISVSLWGGGGRGESM